MLSRRPERIKSVAVGGGVEGRGMESDAEQLNDEPDVSESAVGSTDPAMAKNVHLASGLGHSVLNHQLAIPGFEAALRWYVFGGSLLKDQSHVANTVPSRGGQPLEQMVKI